MMRLNLRAVGKDEARAILRHDYPGCVLWPTFYGFDVLVPQRWDNGVALLPSIASTATVQVRLT